MIIGCLYLVGISSTARASNCRRKGTFFTQAAAEERCRNMLRAQGDLYGRDLMQSLLGSRVGDGSVHKCRLKSSQGI